ncbi:hypothetical protein ACFPRL_03825 [Pseudoclavibacter helvolus]
MPRAQRTPAPARGTSHAPRITKSRTRATRHSSPLAGNSATGSTTIPTHKK